MPLTHQEIEKFNQTTERAVCKAFQEFQLNNYSPWLNLAELRVYHPEKPAKSTIYRWVRERRVPFYKSGKKLAFLKSEIDEWIKNSKKKTISEIENQVEDYLTSKRKRG